MRVPLHLSSSRIGRRRSERRLPVRARSAARASRATRPRARGPHALAYVVTRRYVSEKLAGAPADRAICLIDQGTERSDAMFADKGIGILCFTEEARLENSKCGRITLLGDGVDRLRAPSRPGPSLSKARTTDSTPAAESRDGLRLKARRRRQRRSRIRPREACVRRSALRRGRPRVARPGAT